MTNTRTVVFVTKSRRPPKSRTSSELYRCKCKAKSEIGSCQTSVQKMACHSSKPSRMSRRTQATTNTRGTVVFVTKSKRPPNQELQLSFIDVNAESKVKLEAVKRGYKRRQSRKVNDCQWQSSRVIAARGTMIEPRFPFRLRE